MSPSAPPPAARRLPNPPQPAYDPVSTTSNPLHPPEALLTSIRSSPRRLVSSQTVPIRSARSFTVRAGQVFRLTTPAGPQVGDLNLWSLHNPRERFWAARTRQLHAAHISVGDRLWSCLPYLRPLATIVADSVGGGSWGAYGAEGAGGNTSGEGEENGKGKGAAGGIWGCHDLLGTRCDPYVNALLGGGAFDFQCHSNLVRAVLPLGLDERDVHDVLNVFQVTGLDERGRYWMGTSPAREGDYLEFFAETDLLGALSACPGGDLSRFGWTGAEGKGEGEGEAGEDVMLATCRPLGIEVYELADRDEVLAGWKPAERPGYKGHHGIKMPVFG